MNEYMYSMLKRTGCEMSIEENISTAFLDIDRMTTSDKKTERQSVPANNLGNVEDDDEHLPLFSMETEARRSLYAKQEHDQYVQILQNLSPRDSISSCEISTNYNL